MKIKDNLKDNEIKDNENRNVKDSSSKGKGVSTLNQFQKNIRINDKLENSDLLKIINMHWPKGPTWKV